MNSFLFSLAIFRLKGLFIQCYRAGYLIRRVFYQYINIFLASFKNKYLMIRLLMICMLICISFVAHTQSGSSQDWDGFVQTVDVTAYRGGQFRFKGYVRAENTNKLANARLWARVDKKKGIAFLDNMYRRPIMSGEWKEYIIEGPIDANATTLRVGGLYFGNGKYYYDKLSLELKQSVGAWNKKDLANEGFEREISPTDWRSIYPIPGYELKRTRGNVFEGNSALMIDASTRVSRGKFVEANGISIYYEEYGKGDTLLLLHGNSQSVRAFDKQIPELSNYFHVIAMDSRGQGYSSEDGKPLTYELMAEDVIAFLNKLKIKKVKLLGWSDGGNTGLIIAMKYPDKLTKLAVMGANLYNDKTSIGEKFNQMVIKDKAQLTKQNKPEDKFQIALINLMLNEPRIKAEELASIQCPTLVMAGSKDIIKEGHTRLIAGNIKNATLVIFDRGTHFEPSENPSRFNKTVTQFFSE
ncbi:MAG: alpha/beta fold hydrolase [Bacteroidetes bacterium]|nr:alpha/beta fold hydrolase [Bacteroidota bacterium]